MMMQALMDGTYDEQNNMEKEITDRVNKAGRGAFGIGRSTTVLATFMKVGPQRASGVRVVSLRPCCCFEPRACDSRIIIMISSWRNLSIGKRERFAKTLQY